MLLRIVDFSKTIKARIKLSRKMAIFEFSSSNGYSSLNINFECRTVFIKDTGDENVINFSYVVRLPYLQSEKSCKERNYEYWETTYFVVTSYCLTTFEG